MSAPAVRQSARVDPTRAVVAARVGACIALGVVVMLAAAPARASLPLTLTWEAPAGCPTSDDVRAELERLVRFPPGHTPPALIANGHIETRDGRWRLRLRTARDGLPGERELEADTCASLARAATFVLALAFGVGDGGPEDAPSPSAVDEHPARPAPRPRVVEAPAVVAPPPPAPAAPPPVLAPTPTVVTTAPPSRVAVPTIWSVVAESRVSDGPLPGVDWGAGVGVDVTRGRFVARLHVVTWLPTDDPVAGTAVRTRFSGVGLDPSICGISVERWRLTLAACTVGGVAALHGASSGGLTAGAATAPWYTVGAAVRVRLRLARAVHAELLYEADTSLTRPRFALTYVGDVHALPRVVSGLGLGFAVDL